MREASWKDCVENATSRTITPDNVKSQSLLEAAQARIDFLEQIKPGPDNANFLFESYYTSVVQIVHALVLKAGFSVENHLCLGFYLRDVLGRRDLFSAFDDCRFKRNGIIYYGQLMKFSVAKSAIAEISSLISDIMCLQ